MRLTVPSDEKRHHGGRAPDRLATTTAFSRYCTRTRAQTEASAALPWRAAAGEGKQALTVRYTPAQTAGLAAARRWRRWCAWCMQTSSGASSRATTSGSARRTWRATLRCRAAGHVDYLPCSHRVQTRFSLFGFWDKKCSGHPELLHIMVGRQQRLVHWYGARQQTTVSNPAWSVSAGSSKPCQIHVCRHRVLN